MRRVVTSICRAALNLTISYDQAAGKLQLERFTGDLGGARNVNCRFDVFCSHPVLGAIARVGVKTYAFAR